MLKDYEKKIHKNKSTYDLIYGGSFRSGKREKKFIDYFFNKSINVALYGTIKESDFKLPYTNSPKNWLGKVNCNDVIETNTLGFSSIICGEPGYNNNIHTIRQYESILANCVTFIDSDYDTNHIIYPNCDFLYINNGEELESRIKELQTSNNIDYILDAQFEFIDRKSKCGYIKELLDYMEEIKQCMIG